MGPYDLNSILHYEESAFALDPTMPTIVPVSNSNEPIKMGQREGLSKLDIQKINRYYNCSHIQPIIVQVKKAIETGMTNLGSNTNSVNSEKSSMHSLKQPKSYYWFKSASDFQIRTGSLFFLKKYIKTQI